MVPIRYIPIVILTVVIGVPLIFGVFSMPQNDRGRRRSGLFLARGYLCGKFRCRLFHLEVG